MKNKKGFTLTEVLLAVMIVGLIGVALAALTRASARESGVGRSKVVLRSNLSAFMRTLRGDLNRTSRLVMGASGNSSSDTEFELEQYQEITPGQSKRKVRYCFVAGGDSSNIQPEEATRGGVIYRLSGGEGADLSCTNASSSGKAVLANVKQFSLPAGYKSPLFSKVGTNTSSTGLLRVELVVELPTKPVVNDAIDETFALPVGL